MFFFYFLLDWYIVAPGVDFLIQRPASLAMTVAGVVCNARLLIVEFEALGRQIDGAAAV